MRFYRTDDGRWFGSPVEARAAALASNTRWGPVDVPTDKAGLLAWLGQQAIRSPEAMLGPQGDIAQALGIEPADPVVSADLAAIRDPTPQPNPARAEPVEAPLFASSDDAT